MLNKKHKNVMSLQETINDDSSENDIELINIIPSQDEELYDQVEHNMLCEKIIKTIEKK